MRFEYAFWKFVTHLIASLSIPFASELANYLMITESLKNTCKSVFRHFRRNRIFVDIWKFKVHYCNTFGKCVNLRDVRCSEYWKNCVEYILNKSLEDTYFKLVIQRNNCLVDSRSFYLRSTAAGHVGQKSSAHVACSVAAIWSLIPFKWSQLQSKLLLLSLFFFQRSKFDVSNM